MSLRVDLDQLRGLAKEVRSLGDQASSVIAPASSDSDPMSSVRAARQLTQSVFLGTLVPFLLHRRIEMRIPFLIFLFMLLGISGCSAGGVSEPVGSPSSVAQLDIMGSPEYSYKWAVLSKVGNRLYIRFRDQYPYAFDEQGNLETAAEMDKKIRSDGSPVDLQSIDNAVRQMYFQLARTDDLPSQKPDHDSAQANDSTPPSG